MLVLRLFVFARSPRQPEHQKQRAVQLFGRFRVDAAK
jgi:hypothetical protein